MSIQPHSTVKVLPQGLCINTSDITMNQLEFDILLSLHRTWSGNTVAPHYKLYICHGTPALAHDTHGTPTVLCVTRHL